MNVAYPQSVFDTDLEAIKGFAELLKSGFQNPEGIWGTVKLHIPELPQHDFFAKYDDERHIEKHDLDREIGMYVSIPIDTIKRIFKEFEYLDFRDPTIIGTMEFSGNLDYANHLWKPCLPPNNFTLSRFEVVGKLYKAKGYRNLADVEYIHQPTQIQILEAMEESRPIVVTGLEPSPPCRDWSLNRLVEKYADAIVRVRSATQKQNMRGFVQELKDFIANPHDVMVEGFVKPYTEGVTLPEEMWDDFGPLFFDREDFIPPQLWLCSVSTHIPTSSLHCDPLTGFLLQVIGRKRLDLYSADQADLIYPTKSYNNYQPCWFKPEVPDFAIYPKVREAKCLSVTLNAGELLVQPAGWFHQVYALDSPNMSVSYFWRY